MATSPRKWETVKALFDAALELDSSSRSAFLRNNCPDAEARAEVERLLDEHHQAGRFLSTPILGNFSIDAETLTRTQRFSEGELLARRFRIVRFIAAGGMGEVYEAEDEELHERVAVKTIRQEILAQTNAVARFKREVHLARQVTHPNVCRIFDLFRYKPDSAGVQEETVFISMELLRGKTLGARLREEGRMSAGEALPLVGQMASALTAAHAVGVVHRDFKPGNVVLVGSPKQHGMRAVVTDFGLALQLLTSEKIASHSTGRDLLGTPLYMSPEQLEGRPATTSSDLYALGLVIYEMVTGVRPFQSDTPMSAALKRLSETPTPPRKFEPELSPVWESVILRCLERDPAKRFSKAEQVAQALVGEYPPLLSGSAPRKRLSRRETGVLPALGRGLWKIAVPVLLTSLLITGGLYHRSHQQSKRLSEKDTIVLTDFANSTGDAVFDDTLKTALNISLRQSPFLNVLSEGEVAKTLQEMTRPTGTKLTPEVARELCQRAGSKAYLAGSITSLGREYVLGLKAMNCEKGDTLAQEQVTAISKEKVLDALGEAASKVRSELGESLATLQKFDIPLAEVTTSSLPALKAYSLGAKIGYEKGPAAGLPFLQRAIELDPNFATGYAALGEAYYGLGELGQASEYLSNAFRLRDHTSGAEKLNIIADYYQFVTGELDKAARTLQEKVASYPREFEGYGDLGNVFALQGQYEKAAEIGRQAHLLDPDALPVYGGLANMALALQRFDDSQEILDEAKARKMDSFAFHIVLYGRAFLRADSTAMAEQQRWFAAESDYENYGLALASDTEAYAGHLDKARELTKRALDSAKQADTKEAGAIWQAIAAQREAAYGNATEARQAAEEALNVARRSKGVESQAALAFAMAGERARAESLARDLAERFPVDTQMQSLWLPAIHAQLALDRKNPASALNTLQAAVPIELGQIAFVANISCLYHVYVRGEAYLAAGQGSAAAAEFQKILDHDGIVWNCWTGALAHLGVARADALQARTSQGEEANAARIRSLAAYKEFLKLWKDADPDISILKQAKAEYARLQ